MRIGSIISNDGEIEEDVDHRIRFAWLKWILAFGMLCDWRILKRLKRKFSNTTIRPMMTYGVVCWPIGK